ncbi:von Willebrand factor D and EGF domain-containing protein-like [Saccoglossus kowalevskii]
MSITSVICPADCNGHGTCVNGLCECAPGYGSTDCSVDLAEAPEVFIAHNGGLCDVSEEPCLVINIQGSNFVESDDLTCHINTITIRTDGFDVSEDVYTVPATFLSYEVVQCPTDVTSSRRRRRDAEEVANQKQGSLVSISNDGTLTSYELIVIVYNSRCDVCNGTDGYCVQRDDICIVDGECYELSDPKCKDNTYIIVGAVVGSTLFVLILIIIIISVICIKKKKKTKIGDYDRD